MYENKEQKERAVLAGVNTGAFDAEASIDELAELADTAGAEVLAKFIQNRESPDNAAYLGIPGFLPPAGSGSSHSGR